MHRRIPTASIFLDFDRLNNLFEAVLRFKEVLYLYTRYVLVEFCAVNSVPQLDIVFVPNELVVTSSLHLPKEVGKF